MIDLTEHLKSSDPVIKALDIIINDYTLRITDDNTYTTYSRRNNRRKVITDLVGDILTLKLPSRPMNTLTKL